MSPRSRTPHPVRERLPVGLLDTSVLLSLEDVSVEDLPQELAVSAVTMAELAAGPAATLDAAERARRQDRLQRAEATFDPLPFGIEAARAYGRVYAAVVDVGRQPGAGWRTFSSPASPCPRACPSSRGTRPTSQS
jgi:predicted nucleic acid-binding protein